jgi:hypothetical protein
MPVVPGGWQFEASPKLVRGLTGTGNGAQEVEHLPSKHETLSSNAST